MLFFFQKSYSRTQRMNTCRTVRCPEWEILWTCGERNREKEREREHVEIKTYWGKVDFGTKCEYVWNCCVSMIYNLRRIRGMYYWYRAKCQHNTFLLHYIARYQLFDCLHEVLFLNTHPNTHWSFLHWSGHIII